MRRNVPVVLAGSLAASLLAGCTAPEAPAPAVAEDPRAAVLQAEAQELEQRAQDTQAQRQQLEALLAEMQQRAAEQQAQQAELERTLAEAEEQNRRLKAG